MTIIEALQWANEKLKKESATIELPMLDAEVILASILNVPKSWIFSHFNDKLQAHQEKSFRESINRRLENEPVAYIIGKKEFYKRDFFVNRFTLIPRPATETLIDEALKISNESDPDKTIFADIGTGSGAIVVTLASETDIPAIATDISQQALSVAKQNADTQKVSEQINFRLGDLLTPIIEIFQKIKDSGDPNVSSVYPYSDLILCANLPYLTDEQVEKTAPNVRGHEPHLALAAGQDGLEAYWRLYRQLLYDRDLLPRNLTTIIEIDPSQTKKIIPLIKHSFPHAEPLIIKDLEGHNRIVVAKL